MGSPILENILPAAKFQPFKFQHSHFTVKQANDTLVDILFIFPSISMKRKTSSKIYSCYVPLGLTFKCQKTPRKPLVPERSLHPDTA